MYTPKLLIRYFQLNHRVIHMQIKGLTHEDSLRQPPFRGNCLNWILGHIVVERDEALALLDVDPIWGKDEISLYQQNSDPITEDTRAKPFEQIVVAFDQSQEGLEKALKQLTGTDLDKPKADGEGTIGEGLAGLCWHEAYHTGQTEYLRQLTGVNDKVI